MLNAATGLFLLAAAVPAPGRASLLALATIAQVAPGGGWRGSPPPPPPVEHVRPRRGWVWVEGNYEMRDGRWMWVGGHWERERPGRRWHGGHWEWQGDRYVWVRGSWIEGPAFVAGPGAVVANPAPPPPPPAQPAPPPPAARPGWVWIPGANEWRDGRYVWVEGHWEKERRGDRWTAGHWDRDGDRHYWHPGGWEHGGGEGPGYAQVPPRGAVSILGQVRAPNGAPVPGVTVVLAGTSEGRAITDGNGRYSFMGLAPGSYSVRPSDHRCNPDVANLNNLGGSVVQDFNCHWR